MDYTNLKNGDIVVMTNDEYMESRIIIVDKVEQSYTGIYKIYTYAELDMEYDDLFLEKDEPGYSYDVNYYIFRLANEEEKQKLFDAIKANGYKWNSLTKTLEPKFKNGDVVVSGAGNIALFSHTANMYGKPIIYYHCILSPHIFCIDSNLEIGIDCGIGGVEDCCLASYEQKERLFNALKEKGYKWNPYTKSLEKLIVPKFKVEDKIQNKKRKKERRTIKLCENDGYWTTEDSWIRINEQDDWELVPNKFDISTLKPFESKVLVRDSSDCIWKPAIFGFSHRIGCCAVGGASWNQVIPYEGNEHLLKTNNDCDEYYKNW